MFNWLVGQAYAAADPLIVNAAGDFATSAKENVTGTVTSATVLGAIAVIFGLILGIALIMKLVKRSAR